MPRINEGRFGEENRESQDRIVATPKEIETELGKETSEPKTFEELKSVIFEFNERKYKDVVSDEELTSYLRLLARSEGIFEQAIADARQREEALKCLKSLLVFTDYAEEVFPEDSSEEMKREQEQQREKFKAFEARVYNTERNVAKTTFALIKDLQPAIEESKKENPDSSDEELVLDLYQTFLRSNPNAGKKIKGANFLANHIAEIEKGFDSVNWLGYLEYVQDIIDWGHAQSIQEAVQMLERVLLTCDDQVQFERLLSFLFRSEYGSDEAIEVVENELIRVGLPPFEVFDDWKISTDMIKEHKFVDAFIVNLRRIKEIEKAKPGSAKFLYETEEFGISDFGRYPKEILLDMIENYENREKPYGLIIYPKNDWNSAFYNDTELYKSLYEQLGGIFLLRVAECEDKADIARTLIKLDKRYNPADGSGHKISLLILGGHGQKDSIQFGGKDKKHSLYTDDLMGKGVQKTSKFFVENPTIILSSCSTGTEGGIGPELSKKFGAKVIAPKIPTSPSSMTATKNIKGEFEFSAEFRGEDSKNSYQRGSLKNNQ